MVLPEGSLLEERLTFDKWLEDNRKRFYTVPDRHIRYATTKAFFRTKMVKGSSVQSHGVKMLSLVEKLEDLKAGLENDTYIDVILQSLPPSYDPFIVNYNMNRLEKRGFDLQGERQEDQMLEERKKGKGRLSQPLLVPEAPLLPQREREKGKLGVLSGRWQMICACIVKEMGIERGSVHNSSPTQVLERSRKLSKDEMILRLRDGKAVAAEAVGSLSLVAVPQTPYEIWYGKPASYKYLRLWGSPANVKRLVGDKLDSRSSLCRDEVLLEESSEEPRHGSTTSFEPQVITDGVPVLRRSTRESRAPERYGFMGLTSQLDNDPKTYGEAMSDIDSDKWLEAMKSKMNSIGSNQVWTLVDPPKGVRPVGCKWVYKCKLGADGEVTAFEARLVAKGYTQRPRVDFEETYSPVAMNKSIRILLAIAAWYDYEIWQMDVKTAFLNDFVEEEIYMDQPEGFTTIGEEQKVLGDIKAWLSTQFSMKDMGEASYILGIKIYKDRSRRMLGLTQSSYIEKVLKRFKMENSKRGFLPMRHGIKLSKKQSPKTDEKLKRMSNISYASAVGSIQYQACAGEAHWSAVKTILKYLKRTKDMFLIYGGGELILEGYNDASFQSDDDDTKSQSGFDSNLMVVWLLGKVPSKLPQQIPPRQLNT
ncbi:UNVERIFIED_CONTAM: hypothetical protein Slati_4453200 [Sesamum latifolium]|uniref:Reverse transcriptase Ty1/copia-type domain-containing protein n=1 Tax=Sesamum latifolium TaxID=2727402 RepID=A0AAW2SQV6_9LAMI